MSEPTFTPGPWKWGDDWDDPDVFPADPDVDRGGAKYADMYLFGPNGEEIIPLRIDHREWLFDAAREPNAIRKADRDLIAAAPELYEALKGISQLIESGYLVRNTSADNDPGWAMKQIAPVRALAAMQTALAKAEGRA